MSAQCGAKISAILKTPQMAFGKRKHTRIHTLIFSLTVFTSLNSSERVNTPQGGLYSLIKCCFGRKAAFWSLIIKYKPQSSHDLKTITRTDLAEVISAPGKHSWGITPSSSLSLERCSFGLNSRAPEQRGFITELFQLP